MSAAAPRLDWRSLDRAALDKSLSSSRAVEGSLAIIEGWGRTSAALRARHPEALDLAYGPRPRQRIDLLKAADGAPTLVFLHGGFWQMLSKDDFTFVAAGLLPAGINVAFVGYTLAPDATLDDMVLEVRAALDWLGAHLAGLGGDPAAVFVGGWSAGAHLAVMVMDHPLVRGVLGISGLYELAPLAASFVNGKLGLDDAAVDRNSPQRHIQRDMPPLALVVGGAELAMMRQQTEDYAAALTASGAPVTFETLAGANHFTILDQLADPDGAIAAMARRLMSR
ncbi:Acetyl esterase/lipase [Kaistia soli DSM 19436]|uniref:Acetyl esterase/lipase n=1 Tax=Kaistia soli DSM 19436 TaxID=1122133 RepID=A0A1M4U1T5_9HYPH|nr:alpha/beta hydrolase [Kaistia soli]SHE50702.1 Acetyl esterase/lipase [Kaistia soli DSM 19436]